MQWDIAVTSEINTTLLLQQVHAQLRRLEQAEKTSGGDEPPRDTHIDARLGGLESDVKHIHSHLTDVKSDVREIKNHAREDFRILLWTGAASVLALAGLMAKGFGWL